jgi:NAD(P)-dependent dehydrogenase (short-subunit alcohol dehydrogenase family)
VAELGTVLITGGASGLGAAIAQAVREEGGTPVVLDRNPPADELVDLSRPREAEAAVRRVAEAHGGLDAVVTAAGTDACGDILDVDADAWDRVIAVNLIGTAAVVRAALPHLERSRGRVVTVASTLGLSAVSDATAYCASKFGVVGLSKVLAAEWGPRGVRVNTISPTVVLTELGRKAWDGPHGDALKKLIPVGRFAYPDEVAAAAVYLAADASAMVNGADLVIDGGYTIV